MTIDKSIGLALVNHTYYLLYWQNIRVIQITSFVQSDRIVFLIKQIMMASKQNLIEEISASRITFNTQIIYSC